MYPGSDTAKLLSKYGEGYALLYEIGVGLGAEISQLLRLLVDDVKGREYLSMHVGPRKCQRTFVLPKVLCEKIGAYIQGRDGILFIDDEGVPITEDGAGQVLEKCGITKPFLNITMGRCFRETGDIYYPMFFMDLPSVEATKIAIC